MDSDSDRAQNTSFCSLAVKYVSLKDLSKWSQPFLYCTQSEVEHLKEHRVPVVVRKDPASEDSVWIKNYTVMKTVMKRLRNAPQPK